MGESNKIKLICGEVDSDILKDSMGRFRTRGLFIETCSSTDTPIYTLRDESFNNYPSIYKEYIDKCSEYDSAISLFGSWRHWEKLIECDWFMTGILDGRSIAGFDGLLKWREELDRKISSIGTGVLLKLAQEGNINAAKALLGLTEKDEKKLKKLKKKDIKEREDKFYGEENLFTTAKRLI